MREIKVQCDCGQKYKFEVEPVNGQMPYVIACPVCGLDGTKKANALLLAPAVPVTVHPTPVASVSAEVHTEHAPAPISSAPPPPPPSVRMRVPSAPPPAPLAAAVVESSVAATQANPQRLRINSTAHNPPDSPAPVATAEAPPPAPRRFAGMSRPEPVAQTPGRRPSFALGLLGAFIGAVIGGVIYFGIFSYSGFQIGLVGIGVGFLAGLGARLLGKEGSNELGVITATLTLVGILGAQYFVAAKWWHEFNVLGEETASALYQELVDEAKQVVAAVPNGSDQEIRLYLAKSEVEGTTETPDLAGITGEDIEEFREGLPQMRELASGKLTQEAWQNKVKEEAAAEKAAMTAEEKDDEDRSFKWFFMLLLLNKVNLFSLVAGAGLAYKMSTDAPG